MKTTHILLASVLGLSGMAYAQTAAQTNDQLRQKIQTLNGEISQINANKIQEISQFKTNLQATYSSHKDLVYWLSQQNIWQGFSSANDGIANATSLSGTSSAQLLGYKTQIESALINIFVNGTKETADLLSAKNPPAAIDINALLKKYSGDSSLARNAVLEDIHSEIVALKTAKSNL